MIMLHADVQKHQRFQGKCRRLLILRGRFVSHIGLSYIFLESVSVKALIAQIFNQA